MAYFYCAAYAQVMVCKTSSPCGQRLNEYILRLVLEASVSIVAVMWGGKWFKTVWFPAHQPLLISFWIKKGVKPLNLVVNQRWMDSFFLGNLQDFTYSRRRVNVSVSDCVLLSCARVVSGRKLKIKKYVYIIILILPWNGFIAKVIRLDLDLLFLSKKLKC